MLAALLLAAGAAPAAAREPTLGFPVDCVLGESCFVQQYPDRDPGPGAADYTCGTLSYDTHAGTDIALPSLAAMAAGVAVRAAAPGTVLRTRDGMPDIAVTGPGAPELDGQDCGNGVVISHGAGWESQYCHLKQGSVAVRPGQRVSLRTVIGEIGLSGRTEFPHLHLTLRRDGETVDPFHPDDPVLCGAGPARDLWRDPLPYRPGGLIAAGFAPGIPEYTAVTAGTAAAERLDAAAPALVLWGLGYGLRSGDALRIEITGPAGPVVDETLRLDRSQARAYRALGRPSPAGGWPAGRYEGTVTLFRGGQPLDTLRRAIEID